MALCSICFCVLCGCYTEPLRKSCRRTCVCVCVRLGEFSFATKLLVFRNICIIYTYFVNKIKTPLKYHYLFALMPRALLYLFSLLQSWSLCVELRGRSMLYTHTSAVRAPSVLNVDDDDNDGDDDDDDDTQSFEYQYYTDNPKRAYTQNIHERKHYSAQTCTTSMHEQIHAKSYFISSCLEDRLRFRETKMVATNTTSTLMPTKP